MRSSCLCACGTVLLMLAFGHVPLSAQGREHAAIEGGVAAPTQSGATGTESVTYVTAPGGTTLGWLAGAGVHVGSRVMVFGEWSTTGWMSATEPSRYDITYLERRRDQFVVAGIRAVVPLGRSAALEPMIGLAFTFAEATSQATYPSLPRPDQPRVTHDLDTGVGPAFGIGARLGGGALALVPSVSVLRSRISAGRFDNTADSPHREIEAIYPGGYPGWTVRPSISVRLRF